MLYDLCNTKPNVDVQPFVLLSRFQSDRLHEEELEGIREKMAVEVAKLEEDIASLEANLQRQSDIIEQRLRVVSATTLHNGQGVTYLGNKTGTGPRFAAGFKP